MDKSRNYILDRITSKKTTPEEFNFDALQAPPLGLFFDQYDIQELHSIATSVKLAGKPQERYAAIDRVCKRRGLVKFGSGTNRVVYRHPEFPDILFKIASDAVGLGDNPAEFRNQCILKPFVCKIFEISPCGTVALVERLIPITSREEFLSVADDVFELITEWLVGEYVLADIGALYFMNFSIRKNFGVCLVDYPYLYKLDGNKLYCRKKDPTSPTGTCDGEIDYDDSFSRLVCTKCGAVYKAKELELKIKTNELVVEGKRTKMKIKVSGGTTNEKRVIENGNSNFAEQKDSIKKSNPTTAKPATNNTVRISFGGGVDGFNIKDGMVNVNGFNSSVLCNIPPKYVPIEDVYVNGVAEKKTEEVAKNNVTTIKLEQPVEKVDKVKVAPVVQPKVEAVEPEVVEEKVEEVVEEVVEEQSVEAEEVKTEEVAAPVEEERKVVSAITISDEVKKEAIANKKEEPAKGAAQTVDELVSKIEEILDGVDVDAIKNDIILRLIDASAKHAVSNPTVFKKLSHILAIMYDDLDTLEEAFSDAEFAEMILKVYNTDTNISSVTLNHEDNDLEIAYETELYHTWDEHSEYPLGKVDSGIFTIAADAIRNAMNESNGTYTGFSNYHAKVVNIKELFPTEKLSRRVIVFVNDENQYATVDGKIVVGTDLDDKYIDSLSVVSKDWFENLSVDVPEAVAAASDFSEDEKTEKVEV